MCKQASKSRATKPTRRLAGDTEGASEVLGYILSFGILATILVLALVGFNLAAANTKERIVELRAESVAQRVAGAVIDLAILAETSGTALQSYERVLDLPEDLEGHDYQLRLLPDAVEVTVEEQVFTEPLLGAGNPDAFAICATPQASGPNYVQGGLVTLRYDANPNPASATCDADGAMNPFDTFAIFLEIP